MRVSCCSFGRTLLGPFASSGSRRPSLRRVLRLFLAARRRFPAGRLSLRPPFELVRLVDHWGVPVGFSWRVERCPLLLRWVLPDGGVAVMLEVGR